MTPSTGGQRPGPTIHNPAHTGHYAYERRQRELRQQRAAKVARSGEVGDREASSVEGERCEGPSRDDALSSLDRALTRDAEAVE